VSIAKIKRIDLTKPHEKSGDLKLVTYSHTNSDGEVIETALELKTVTDSPAVETLIRSRMRAQY
jgi:hypothetical protein